MTGRQFDGVAVDALVSGYLDRLGQDVDGPSFLTRLRRREPLSHAATPSRLMSRRVRWGLVAAAAVVLVVATSIPTSLSTAEASNLVAQTRYQLQAGGIDRAYDLIHQPVIPGVHDGVARVMPCHVIWTRGDRFWADMRLGRVPWQWGRDENGNVWLALRGNLGLRFGPGEIPRPLREFILWRQVDLNAILAQLLADFQIREDTPAEVRVAGLHRITTAPRGGRVIPHLRHAQLDIDPRRREIQRLVLHTGWLDRTLGVTTITLRERGSMASLAYRLEGHLEPGAQVLDARQPLRRLQVLARHLREVLGAEWQKLDLELP